MDEAQCDIGRSLGAYNSAVLRQSFVDAEWLISNLNDVYKFQWQTVRWHYLNCNTSLKIGIPWKVAIHTSFVTLDFLFWKKRLRDLACENIHFSSLFVAEDVSRGGTSATQWQKFHTDDANQCLHNKSGSHGVPNINLSNFACLLFDFGKVLCWSAHELRQNSNASSGEDYIPQILTVLSEILRVYIWPLWFFVFCLSFVNNS